MRARQLHTALGLGPLAAYVVYHLYQGWPALESREAWVDRARATGLPTWLGGCVLAAIVLHGALGVRRFRERRATDPLARFQLFTGVLLLATLAYHVSQVWPAPAGPHATVRDVYDTLWGSLGQPEVLVGYVLLSSCVAFHFAVGLSRVWARAAPDAPSRAQRYVAGALGLALFVGYMQLVARFAIGEGMIPTARPVAAPQAPPPLPGR